MSQEELLVIWQDIINLLEDDDTNNHLVSRLKYFKPYEVTETSFVVVTKVQTFMKNITPYNEVIEEYLSMVTDKPYQFEVIYNPEIYNQINMAIRSTPITQSASIVEPQPAATSKESLTPLRDVLQDSSASIQPSPTSTHNQERKPTNRKNTFEDFVIGESNRIAFQAAQMVAQNSGELCNPFYIHSKSGLGKSHLLLAIKNYVEEHYPNKKVCYTTSKEFQDTFIDAITYKKVHKSGSVRLDQYLDVDILLIDDIQFLINGEQTVKEFFNIFEKLYNTNKQIVIASDRASQDLKFDERLISRFKSGLVVEIERPTIELKTAIIKQFCDKLHNTPIYSGVDPSDDVLQIIAQESSSNIREIEGFLTTLYTTVYTATNMDIPNKYEIQKQAREHFSKGRPRISIREIQELVAHRNNISFDDIIGKKRNKEYNHPRQIAMYLAKQLTDHSLSEIGDRFGNRDHSTISNGIGNIENLLKYDRIFYEELQSYIDILKG